MREEGNATLSQTHRAHKQCILSTHNVPKYGEYVSQRALGAYIAATCRPEICVCFLYAAEATEPDEKDACALKKLIAECHSSPDVGLSFVALDRTSLAFSVPLTIQPFHLN